MTEPGHAGGPADLASVDDQGDAVVERVPARTALAGNPSDGYEGAVLSTPIRAAAATVVLRTAERPTITVDGAAAPAAAPGEGPAVAGLVGAAIDAYADLVRPVDGGPYAIDVSTTIPRTVGLAGSSAIVIAVLRALDRRSDGSRLDPDELAVVALAAEVEHLGIAAGLQDRVVQAHDATMHMEFGRAFRRMVRGRPTGTARAVLPHPGTTFFVAHLTTPAAPSATTHGPLRARYESGDPDVRRAMDALADHARGASAALAAGDAELLGEAMDGSFDIRRTLVPVDPVHEEMIERARAVGAAANSCGSGGAIVVLAGDPAVETRARSALAELGCAFLDVVPA